MKRLTTNPIALAGVSRYVVAFGLAMVLMIVPLPEALLLYRPDFVTLILIYFCLYHPDSIGVLVAFLVGLLVDVVTFGILGQQALAKVIIAYCCVRFCETLRSARPIYQALFVLIMLATQSAIFSVVQLYANEGNSNLALWTSALVSAVVWIALASFKQKIKSVRNAPAK